MKVRQTPSTTPHDSQYAATNSIQSEFNDGMFAYFMQHKPYIAMQKAMEELNLDLTNKNTAQLFMGLYHIHLVTFDSNQLNIYAKNHGTDASSIGPSLLLKVSQHDMAFVLKKLSGQPASSSYQFTSTPELLTAMCDTFNISLIKFIGGACDFPWDSFSVLVGLTDQNHVLDPHITNEILMLYNKSHSVSKSTSPTQASTGAKFFDKPANVATEVIDNASKLKGLSKSA